MRRKKKVLVISFIVLLIFTTVTYVCNYIIHHTTVDKLYTNAKSIPYNRVGLLLGTAKYTESGGINPYYLYRVEAAVELLKNKKIKYLVVSGDSSRARFNEPWSMRRDLINSGVDSTVIFLDCDCIRTFDSVVRLKEIYGQDTVTIISQPFHNERALYIASKKGLTAIGFNAKDIGGITGFKTQCREKLARVKVFIDFVFGIKPKYAGDKVLMPAS